MNNHLESIDLGVLDQVTGGVDWKGAAVGAMGLLGWNDESMPSIERPAPNPQEQSRTMAPIQPPAGPGGARIGGSNERSGGPMGANFRRRVM